MERVLHLRLRHARAGRLRDRRLRRHDLERQLLAEPAKRRVIGGRRAPEGRLRQRARHRALRCAQQQRPLRRQQHHRRRGGRGHRPRRRLRQVHRPLPRLRRHQRLRRRLCALRHAQPRRRQRRRQRRRHGLGRQRHGDGVGRRLLGHRGRDHQRVHPRDRRRVGGALQRQQRGDRPWRLGARLRHVDVQQDRGGTRRHGAARLRLDRAGLGRRGGQRRLDQLRPRKRHVQRRRHAPAMQRLRGGHGDLRQRVDQRRRLGR